jgi:hypothetical protein
MLTCCDTKSVSEESNITRDNDAYTGVSEMILMSSNYGKDEEIRSTDRMRINNTQPRLSSKLSHARTLWMACISPDPHEGFLIPIHPKLSHKCP